MLSPNSTVSIRRLVDFSDPVLEPFKWQQLLDGSTTKTIFLTQWWQEAWWNSFGRGELLLFGLFTNDELTGIAPLFADTGMIFFVGSGGSDYLDFIGGTPPMPLLEELLEKASSCVADFVGFRFYHVPDGSRTGGALEQTARNMGLKWYEGDCLGAPRLDLKIAGQAAVRKKSLVRHHRNFERTGTLSVRHFSAADDILPRLDAFFEQHIARWAVTPHPSLFLDPAQCRFYRNLAMTAKPGCWLRFTEIRWNDAPIAFHFGFSYQRQFMWYKPCFAIEHAKQSPGEVLLRSLITLAIEEGCAIFDLGLGEEGFKDRFATSVPVVRNHGLYPPKSAH